MNKIIIEKDILIHNINAIKKRANLVGEKAPKIIAVVKGNSFGMGVSNVIPILKENDISFFATATIEEALEVREIDKDCEILILNSYSYEEDIKRIVSNNLTMEISSIDNLKKLIKECEMQDKIVNAQIKLDTGFCRFGFRAEDFLNDENKIIELKELIQSQDRVKITGIYSHFQQSFERNSKRTKEQFNLFLNVINRFKNNGLDINFYHISNSEAFFKYPEMFLDAVRLGGAFTGRAPSSYEIGLKRVGYLETNILDTKKLKKDDRVGYGSTYKIKEDTNVAIVGAGYYDGIFIFGPRDEARTIDKLRHIKAWLISLFQDENKYVIINQKKYKVLGRIGMSNFVIDIGNDDIKPNDKVRVEVNLVLANQKIPRILV